MAEGVEKNGVLEVLCFCEEEKEKKDASFELRQVQPASTTTGWRSKNLLLEEDMVAGGGEVAVFRN